MVRQLLLCLLLLLAATVRAETTGSVDIGKHWQVAREIDGPVTVGNIGNAGLNWQPSRWSTPNLGFVNGTYWLRLDLAPNQLAPGRWRLWIRNSLLADVSFYLISNGEVKSHQIAGLDLTADDLASPFRSPAFSLLVKPDQPYQILLRVHSASALQVPAELLTEQRFLADKEQADLVLGVFLGVLLAMALYNLLLFLIHRELSFLLYVGHACGLLLFVASWQGLGPQYLWPELTVLQRNSIGLATFLVIGFSTWFCGVFLELNRDNFPWVGWFRSIRNIAFAGALITPLLSAKAAIFSSSLLSFPAVLLVAKAIISRASMRQRPYRLFAFGWALYVTGAFMMGLNKFGFIEVTSATENLLLWSSVLDMVLLCIALGDKYYSKRRDQLERQRQSLQDSEQQVAGIRARVQREQDRLAALGQTVSGQEEYGRQLSLRLRERERELEQSRRLLEQCSETDTLTGLKNRRYFTDRLQDEINRGQHLGGRFSVLLLDVDHFRHINQEFGHLAGDECLSQIGDLLRQQLKRPADVLCRFSGEKFAVLLPDTDAGGASQLAEIMRGKIAECPLLSGGQGIMATVSVGVSEGEPQPSLRPELLLSQAERALQRAKSDGRNCVVVAG